MAHSRREHRNPRVLIGQRTICPDHRCNRSSDQQEPTDGLSTQNVVDTQSLPDRSATEHTMRRRTTISARHGKSLQVDETHADQTSRHTDETLQTRAAWAAVTVRSVHRQVEDIFHVYSPAQESFDIEEWKADVEVTQGAVCYGHRRTSP